MLVSLFSKYPDEGLKKLSLDELDLLKRYRKITDDKFNELFLERKNTNLSEVINYIETHFSITSDSNNIKKLILFLPMLKIKDVLRIKNIVHIPNDIVDEYLLNDLSWLFDKELIKKIDKKYLSDIVIKNHLFDTQILNNVSSVYLEEELINILAITNYKDIPNFQTIYEIYSKTLPVEVNHKILSDATSNHDYEIGILVINNMNELYNNYKEEILNFINIFPMSVKDIKMDTVLSMINEPEFNNSKAIKILLNSVELRKNLNSDNIYQLLLRLPMDEMASFLYQNNDVTQKVSEKLGSYAYQVLAIYLFNHFDEMIPLLNDSLLAKLVINHTLEIYNIKKYTDINNYSVLLKNKIEEKILKNQDVFNLMSDLEYNVSNSMQDKIVNNQLSKEEYKTVINNLSKYNASWLDLVNYYNTHLEFKEECFQSFETLWNQILQNLTITNSIVNPFLLALCQDERNFNNILNSREKMGELAKINVNIFINLSEKNPNFVKKIFSNPIYLEEIYKNKKDFLKYLYLSNKYHLQNEITNKYNQNFKKLITMYPKLSIGNTSLRIEMLEDGFLNYVNPDYMKAILSFDTNASDVMIENYLSGKLNEVVSYLDFIWHNITTSYRDLNALLSNYENMKKLVLSISKQKESLTNYQKQMFMEINCQNNMYHINTLEQLQNYFLIRSHSILSKDTLKDKDVAEMFLNTSSLTSQNLFQDFNFEEFKKMVQTGYFEHKYVKSGKIDQNSYEYLKQVLYACEHPENKNYIVELIDKYNLKENITISQFSKISRDMDIDSYKEQMTSVRRLEELSKNGSLVKKEYHENIPVYILEGVDYKFLFHEIRTTKGTQTSTFSREMDSGLFPEYILYSEKLKETLQGKILSDEHIGEQILSNPESFYEIEGISTISTQPVTTEKSYKFPMRSTGESWAMGWSGDSDVLFGTTNSNDGGVCHELRSLYPNSKKKSVDIEDFYSNYLQPETWFYRMNQKNQEIKPDFIFAPRIHSDSLKAAKYFGCPIIIVNAEKYKEPARIVEETTKKEYIKEPSNKNFYNYWYRNRTKSNIEKLEFLCTTLEQLEQNFIITETQYFEQLENIKYNFFEMKSEEECDQLFNYMDNFINMKRKSLDKQENFQK